MFHVFPRGLHVRFCFFVISVRLFYGGANYDQSSQRQYDCYGCHAFSPYVWKGRTARKGSAGLHNHYGLDFRRARDFFLQCVGHARSMSPANTARTRPMVHSVSCSGVMSFPALLLVWGVWAAALGELTPLGDHDGSGGLPWRAGAEEAVAVAVAVGLWALLFFHWHLLA